MSYCQTHSEERDMSKFTSFLQTSPKELTLLVYLARLDSLTKPRLLRRTLRTYLRTVRAYLMTNKKCKVGLILWSTVWQEFGIKEYMEAMQEDGATAIHAARHGDYSLLWEFAKERKVLIASTLLPLAAMVRFPGLFGFFLRLGVLFTVSVLQQIPPRVAYNIFRQLIFRKR